MSQQYDEEEMLARQAEAMRLQASIYRDRISTLEALTDQLAEAAGLIAEVDVDSYGDSWTGPDSTVWDQCHPTVQQVLDARTALRAYEADKEAHRGRD